MGGLARGGLLNLFNNILSGTLSMGGSIIPATNNVYTLGSNAFQWLSANIASLTDSNGVSRWSRASSSPTTYRGACANTGTNAAHEIGNSATLSGNTRIANFHNDNTMASAESYIHNAGDFVVASSLGTEPSATGVTVNMAGAATRTFVHKVTVAETALTAAATTEDITLWTVPAKTKITRVIADCTTGFTGGGLTNMTVMVGPSAGSNAYLLAGSIFAAATLGDVVAEIGASLIPATLADIPSFSGTTAISARFTSTTANVVAATAGSVTFYIEGTVYV